MRALLILLFGITAGPFLIRGGPIGIGVLVFFLILIGNVGKSPQDMNR